MNNLNMLSLACEAISATTRVVDVIAETKTDGAECEITGSEYLALDSCVSVTRCLVDELPSEIKSDLIGDDAGAYEAFYVHLHLKSDSEPKIIRLTAFTRIANTMHRLIYDTYNQANDLIRLYTN